MKISFSHNSSACLVVNFSWLLTSFYENYSSLFFDLSFQFRMRRKTASDIHGQWILFTFDSLTVCFIFPAFHRYIREADCICESCIGSTGLGCRDVKQTFTYFIVQTCQNGLALMNQVNTTVTVGCHCVDASTSSTTRSPPRVTPTDTSRK